MVKTTGAEWNRFYNDPKYWPEGCWHEDEIIYIDGQLLDDRDLDKLPNTAQITIEGGYVDVGYGQEKNPSMESYFKKWKKEQKVIFISVECPRDKYDAITEAIKKEGGRIHKP